jgi:hypothetical protein
MSAVRTCENCHCFDNCRKLEQFCRQMVFRLRRIDITLVDNLAENCPYFILSAERTALRADNQPLLFVVNSN